LVRKVKFRILTTYHSKTYNIGSRSTSLAWCRPFETERRVTGWEKDSGVVEEIGRVGDSSSSVIVNEA
jgi:hypothetical protein